MCWCQCPPDMPAASQPHTMTRSWCMASLTHWAWAGEGKKTVFCLLDCRSLADGLCTLCCREIWVCHSRVLSWGLHRQQLGSILLHLGIPAPRPATGNKKPDRKYASPVYRDCNTVKIMGKHNGRLCCWFPFVCCSSLLKFPVYFSSGLFLPTHLAYW